MHSGTVLSDVNGYRKMYSLPQLADCSADAAETQKLPSGQDSCFVQLAQDGSAAPAVDTTDQGWAQETALDVEMASAICPHCSILLVEADSTAFGDLKQAVATAANFKGVVAISNSYGGRDVAEPADSPYAAAAAKGIAVVASSGDAGYGVSAPASFSSVIGVGGTSLVTDAGLNWLSESAWARGGSGCSILNSKAPWQDSALTGCGGKSVVDVAAVADPATGVSVYFDGQWYSFGGTSAAAPIIAGLFAMKANFGDSAGQYLWANRGALRDVTSGTNGRCTNAIFCNAGSGFDGPTGWGSPNGGGAF
jgi:subtilase family serine protease